MILSVSRRTDVPAYYGDWFMNCLRKGEFWLQNPVNHAQLTRLHVSPKTVDCIVFWTKSPEPFLDCLDELDAMGYSYLFQYTLNPYSAPMEPGLASSRNRVQTFSQLSRRLGKERVLWRYDPIVLNESWPLERHEEAFGRLCGELAALTAQVTVSFVQKYRKVRDPSVHTLTEAEKLRCAASFGGIAAEHGLPLKACCARMDLTPYGVEDASCIDKAVLERVCGAELSVKPDYNQRSGCHCFESVDVGVYNTCPRGCTYCYATLSPALVKQNRSQYDPDWPLLCTPCDPGLLKDRDAASEKVDSGGEQLTFL